MKTYPLYMLLEGVPVLVVGGGEVAARKVEALLEAGADVKVVTLEAHPDVTAMAAAGQITLETRGYQKGEGASYVMTIASTNDMDVNTTVANDCRSAGKLVNVVDVPHLCNFIVPSVIRRGGLTISISTGGASPALARRLREKLEAFLPERTAELIDLMGALRKAVIAAEPDIDERKRILTEAVNSPAFDKFFEGDSAPLKELVSKWT